jgi:hypothetical protein
MGAAKIKLSVRRLWLLAAQDPLYLSINDDWNLAQRTWGLRRSTRCAMQV